MSRCDTIYMSMNMQATKSINAKTTEPTICVKKRDYMQGVYLLNAEAEPKAPT
jgi:type III secretory pathway lipoprotein EscJ